MEIELRSFSIHRDVSLKNIEKLLVSSGIEVHNSTDCMSENYILVLLDKYLPEVDQYIRKINQSGSSRILAICFGDLENNSEFIWSIIQAGASDILFWNQHKNPIESAVLYFQRWKQVDQLMNLPVVRNSVVGNCILWKRIIRQIIEIAHFTNDSILLTGESGTGKELIARLIHELDPHKKKPNLVLLDCSSIISELYGSEFFGHERGAFTSAVSSREGAFALADEGTLFLDEVGELPLPLQTALLRVIQEGTYKKLGSNTWQKTNFRLVSATNRNLIDEVQNAHFRKDLYYRLATWIFTLPPLRERSEDIIPLTEYFLKNFCGKDPPPPLSPAVKFFLQMREYPGNVRDLCQLVRQISSRYSGQGPITPGMIPETELHHITESDIGADSHFLCSVRQALLRGKGIDEICSQAREYAYQIVLQEENNNTDRASARLKVSQRSVQMYRKNTHS